MNPEFASKEDILMSNAEIGAVEVPIDMTEQIIEQTKADLEALPKEFKQAFDRIDQGLGGEMYQRTKEVSAELLLQLQDAQDRGNTKTYGSFNDKESFSNERESLGFGDINRIVTGLKMIAEQLATHIYGQQGATKTIDMDQIDGGEPRANAVFWRILTGNSEYEVGDTATVGGYEVRASQHQGVKGIGAESAQIDIIEPGKDNKKEDVSAPDNVVNVDFVRKVPDRRYETNASDGPGEQTRAAA